MSKILADHFTKNGYSRKSLNSRVASYIKSNKLSRTQARKKVANEINYPSWKLIIHELKNNDAEQNYFFSIGFSDKKRFQYQFEDYLKRHSLKDTLINYRKFLVQEYKIKKAIKRKEPRSLTKEITIESVIKELIFRTDSMGAESLLPQHLPDYLLIPMNKSISEWLDKPSLIHEHEDTDFIFMIKSIMNVITTIKSENIRIKKPSFSGEYKYPQDEFIRDIECYSLSLSIEVLSRDTMIKFTKPTIETIFDPDAEQSFQFPAGLKEILEKE
jgi:hypothetical protein